jgi:hypothetical protein
MKNVFKDHMMRRDDERSSGDHINWEWLGDEATSLLFLSVYHHFFCIFSPGELSTLRYTISASCQLPVYNSYSILYLALLTDKASHFKTRKRALL